MNQLPLRPCSRPGCPRLTRGRYCDQHAAPSLHPCGAVGCTAMIPAGERLCQEHRGHRERERGSAASRGYDRDWQAVRLEYLHAHPLCEDCEAAGLVVPAALVHHVAPLRSGGARLDAGNMRALCERCHARTHGRLARAAGNAKKPAADSPGRG